MQNYRNEATDTLIRAILNMENTEQLYSFFEDVCTINEFKDMAQRFEVALMLEEGKNYQQIAAKTNVSTATISRVSRCLNYGNGGYRCAMENLKKGGK